MRLAFFSPLPPAASGIAAYAEALLGELKRLVEVEVFSSADKPFHAPAFDLALYQIGNNADHAHAYRMALEQPGVVVLHEANLHHLIAEMTIRAGDWDAYLREVEYDGGAEALAYARRVRALEVGPDYEGVPMLRRLLERARGLIVHSRFVESKVREAGFRGPVGVIPHGAWLEDADRMGYRHKLGLEASAPLVGIFGHLKPYKRIPESLRAFARLLRVEPRARLLLVGEPHPDLPLAPLIRSTGIGAATRLEGRVDDATFTGYMAACDIVLNLRYPTVGETSGTLLRALGLGKAVLVSAVGAFQEFPREICLQVPVGGGEEDLLYEYLNLLVSRPDLAAALGGNARRWVERECSWPRVAELYASFLESVVGRREWKPPAPPQAPKPGRTPQPEEVTCWIGDDRPALDYAATHMSRLQKTLSITPPGGAGRRILEMGAYMQITPLLQTRLGYAEVRGCYFGRAGGVDRKTVAAPGGEIFTCDIDLFDAERDRFPYEDQYFHTVLCCELVEHLTADPMHMMAEINRILVPGGHLVLTTPNIGSLRAISAILQGFHPGFFPAYLRPRGGDGDGDARHNREYTPKEVSMLLHYAGFEVELLETGPFRDEPKPEHYWVIHLLEHYGLSTDLRGDGIYAVGRKSGPVRERYPGFLYD